MSVYSFENGYEVSHISSETLGAPAHYNHRCFECADLIDGGAYCHMTYEVRSPNGVSKLVTVNVHTGGCECDFHAKLCERHMPLLAGMLCREDFEPSHNDSQSGKSNLASEIAALNDRVSELTDALDSAVEILPSLRDALGRGMVESAAPTMENVDDCEHVVDEQCQVSEHEKNDGSLIKYYLYLKDAGEHVQDVISVLREITGATSKLLKQCIDCGCSGIKFYDDFTELTRDASKLQRAGALVGVEIVE